MKWISRSFLVGAGMLVSSWGSRASACDASTISNHGGFEVKHPEVNVMFWGHQWGGGQAGPSEGLIFGAMQNIMSGPYLSMLGQYGYASYGHNVPKASFYNSDPPCDPSDTAHCKFHDSDIVNFIVAAMYSGLVAPPTAYGDELYTVVLANKDSYGRYIQSFDEGVHSLGFHSVAITTLGTFLYAWVNNTAEALTGVNGVTKAWSHEVIEAVTNSDQNGVHGVGGECEVGDACGSSLGFANGYAVQSYWSVADQRCVAPMTWSAISEYENSPFDWQFLSSDVRQAVAGQYGLLVTDTNDNPWLYRNGNWTSIGGGPGSMFAVSDEAVYRLNLGQTAVNRYAGSWTQVGGPASAIFAGQSYHGGPGLVATSPTGIPYVYTGSSWSQLDTISGSDIGVAAGYIFMASLDHAHLYEYGLTRRDVAAFNIQQLFTGPGVIAATQNGTGNVYAFALGFTPAWFYQGSYGDMFAVSANAGLVGDTLNRAKLYQSMNATVPNPSWRSIANSNARLIGGGSNLYATAPATTY